MQDVPERVDEREGNQVSRNVRHKEHRKPLKKPGAATPPGMADRDDFAHSASFSLFTSLFSSGVKRSHTVELLSLRSGFATLFSTLAWNSGRFIDPLFCPAQRAVGVFDPTTVMVGTGSAVNALSQKRINENHQKLWNVRSR